MSSDQPPLMTPVLPAVPSSSATKSFQAPFGSEPSKTDRSAGGLVGAGAGKFTAKPPSSGLKIPLVSTRGAVAPSAAKVST